jgi:3-hydroxypropanoate dehydrogenase
MTAMPSVPEASLQQLFTEARTHHTWLPEPVSDALIHQLYELTKLGPTSANSHPARYVFVKTTAAKEKLKPALDLGNVEKTMTAPVTVIIAADEQFHEQMPKLFPHRPHMGASLAGMSAEKREFYLVQNSALEAASLIFAARALGLSCGPMGGFDRKAVDALFFNGTSWKSMLLINLGHGDPAALRPRLPRLEFSDAARIE